MCASVYMVVVFVAAAFVQKQKERAVFELFEPVMLNERRNSSISLNERGLRMSLTEEEANFSRKRGNKTDLNATQSRLLSTYTGVLE